MNILHEGVQHIIFICHERIGIWLKNDTRMIPAYINFKISADERDWITHKIVGNQAPPFSNIVLFIYPQ